MEYSEFTSKCDDKKCPRKLRYNEKTCIREGKRKKCFSQWSRLKRNKKEKNSNTREDTFIEDCWIFHTGSYHKTSEFPKTWETYCSIWNILTEKEKEIVKKESEFWLQKFIDVAHILPKSVYRNKKYEVTNTVLMGRFFHSRLTNLKHPIYGYYINNEEVLDWNKSAYNKTRMGSTKVNKE